MDWNSALPFIAALTQDLVPTPSSTREQLFEAQQYIARSVLAGQDLQSFGLLSTADISHPPSVDDPSALEYLKPQFVPVTSAPNALRRDFAVTSSPDPQVNYTIAAGQNASVTFGPFGDVFGRLIAIDIFQTMSASAFSFGNAEPYLHLTMQFDPSGTDFGSGGVWIPAGQFVPTAPANAFVGLKVDGGQLISQAGTAAKLTLKLAPTPANAGSSSSITTPSQVSFLFRSTTSRATLVSGSSTGGALSVFGGVIKLQHLQTAASYDPIFGRINFPMQPDNLEFAVTQSPFKLGRFAGNVSILGAAWSLPVVVWSNKMFTDPSGPGGFSLSLNAGLSILPLGRYTPVSCNTSILTIDLEGMEMGGNAGTSPDKCHIISIGEKRRTANGGTGPFGSGNNSSLTCRTPKPFAFRFISQANENESWSFRPHLVVSFDQPRDVNNSRVPFTGIGHCIFTRDQKTDTIRCAVEGSDALFEDGNLLSFAIRNLVFKTSYPKKLMVTGIYVDQVLQSGTMILNTTLRYNLPILPDPYATNIAVDAIHTSDKGPMEIKLLWTGARGFDIDLSFPPGIDVGDSTQIQRPQQPKTAHDFNQVLQAVENAFDIPSDEGPILLDLSTNVSQFGVSFGADRSKYKVAGLALQAPLRNVRVFALPAVQWETVTPLQPDGIPEFGKYQFSYSGPATHVHSKSVTLTPITPREAIDRVIFDYNVMPSSPVIARFSLPFGIVAVTEAKQANPGLLLRSPFVTQVQPTFNHTVTSGDQNSVENQIKLTGCDQISVQVPFSPWPTTGPTGILPTSPSLSGAAIPLFMDLSPPNGATSILGPFIPETFQNDFKDRVPLTRVDLSGFGESVFSNWHSDPPTGVPGISKVYFDVFMGRTARDVVEMTSILFPYVVRVVRAITIERINSGCVARRDSGWQATSDGNYKFLGPSDLQTHPGVVLGVSRVTNIREVNTPPGDLVKFDCMIRLEDGGGFLDVPARDQLGYIVTGTTTRTPGDSRLEHKISLPSPRDYAVKLLASGLGGPIDAVLSIGTSGLKTRITSVSVAPCRKDMQNQVQFAMAAWGSPALPGGGQWSFAQMLTGGSFQAIDSLKGVPLVREGLDAASIPLEVPYNFADPTDLLVPVKRTVYGIVHAADSHRLLFPDPALYMDRAKKGLTSLLPPVLADSFALATATGIFPKLANCIPLLPKDSVPDESQLLQIVNGDHLLFNPGKINLPDIKRELQKDGNVASIVQTVGNLVPGSSKNRLPSEVNLVVDTANQLRTMDLKNVSMIAQNEAKQEVNRVIGDIKTAVGQELTRFVNSNHIFGEALQEVKKVVSFLDTLGVLPPLKISITNEWALEISTGMGLKDFLENIHDPATKALMAKFIQDFELSISARSTLSEAKFKLKMHVTIKVDSGFGLMALGVAGFDLALSTATGLTLSLDLGVGIGITFTVGPFGASAYYSQTQTIMKSKDTWGVGATAVVKAHVDLVVANADLCIEAKLMLVGGTCQGHHEESTIWAWAQVSIALDVSIFWVVNVSVHESAEWSSRLKDGGCRLDQMGLT